MAIPVPAAPNYEIELPLSKKKVKYRPFLIKEEKILLLAVEDGSETAMSFAIEQILTNCTYNKVEIKKLPVADIDYLFIKVREKSIGEKVPIIFSCTNCGKDTSYDALTSDLKIDGNISERNIDLGDSAIVTMKYPTMESTKNLTIESIEDNLTSGVAACIEMITMGNEVYSSEDMNMEDIIEWLDNLQDHQLLKLTEWLENLPIISYYKKVHCSHCNHETEIYFRGLDDFFV